MSQRVVNIISKLKKEHFLRAIVFSSIVCFCQSQVRGQEARETKDLPIPVELFFGNEEIYYLTILNLPIDKDGKFGYFGVASALTPYENARSNNELVISNSLTYKLSRQWFATSGLQFHYAKGTVPFAGLQFFSANPKWLLLFSPNLQWAPNINFETVGIVEYKPKLSKKMGIYSRLQGVFNQNLDAGAHERSLLYLRTGISLGRTSFGLGVNFDFYGPIRVQEENYGVFIFHVF